MKRGLPPLPGQPGPFSLGDAGVPEETFHKAGFCGVQSRSVPAPVRIRPPPIVCGLRRSPSARAPDACRSRAS